MSVVITREDIISYAEVDYIIHHMNEKYIEKLPETLVYFFKEMKDPEYKIYINPYKPLQNQGLKKYTLEIIALLHLKYWCENEERKKELYEIMLKNESKLENQMKEKFSIDNLFDNNSIKVVTEEKDLEKENFSKPKKIHYITNENINNNQNGGRTELVEKEKKENIFVLIKNKIKKFLLL